MKYSAPTLKKQEWELPPVTVNFAPPAVGTWEKDLINEKHFEEDLKKKMIEIFWFVSDINDPRLSESAKQI